MIIGRFERYYPNTFFIQLLLLTTYTQHKIPEIDQC